MSVEAQHVPSLIEDGPPIRAKRSTMSVVLTTLAQAPLTAWFGMIVLLGYAIAALFAPWVAPHGESEVFEQPYAPWSYVIAIPGYVYGLCLLGLAVSWCLLGAGAGIKGRRLLWVALATLVVILISRQFGYDWGRAAELAGNPWITYTGSEFLVGTDQLGRDMLSRLIYGARNTIGIALAATLLSFGIGGTLGMVAGYTRGWLDQILSRLVDSLMSIPSLIFALMLLSVFGSSWQNLIFIIAVLDSTRVFRLARALTMNISVMDYVEAASLRGETLRWIMFQEILPNILPPVILEFGLRFCFVFLTISALGFLGVGIQPPTADWGSMVAENATLITYGNITPLLAAGAIALLTVAVNFIVDWFLHKTSGLKE